MRAGQLLVGDSNAENNHAGEHLGPQCPGTHPMLHLPQALPSLPAAAYGDEEWKEAESSWGPLLVKIRIPVGGQLPCSPHAGPGRCDQAQILPAQGFSRLVLKIWGSLLLTLFPHEYLFSTWEYLLLQWDQQCLQERCCLYMCPLTRKGQCLSFVYWCPSSPGILSIFVPVNCCCHYVQFTMSIMLFSCVLSKA